MALDLTQTLAPDPSLGPDEIKRKQLLAAALMNQGMSTEPIRSPWQGAANLAKALMGGFDSGMADLAEKKGHASANSLWSQYPGSAASTPTPSTAMTSADASGNPNYRDAIASIESGGKYDITGPVTDSGDRAYGKYQVMGSNIPAWTKAALGREMSPQEFLANPQAQDATFDHRFGQYVNQYGNPQDAASMWFSGRPLAKAGNASDMLGTSVPSYVAKFNAALQGGAQPQGTQVASADAGFVPQSGSPDLSGAPLPPARPDDIEGGLPNSVRPAATFTNAPVEDTGDEAAPASAAAKPAQQASASGGMSDRAMWAQKVLGNPWASSAQQQIAASILKDEMSNKEKFSTPYKDEFGNVVQRGPDGKISILNAAKDQQDKTPAQVQLYQYAQKDPAFADWLAKNGGQDAIPSLVKEYQFYEKQEIAAGRTPMPFGDYQKQKGLKFADFGDEMAAAKRNDMVKYLADRDQAGDTSWRVGLAKEPGLIKEVQAELARRRDSGDSNATPQSILQGRANQAGRVKEQGTLGTSTANNTLYGNAAANTIDTAIMASRDVPRTNWVPVNKLIQGGEAIESNPKLAAFRTALMTTVNDYAKATTPTGTPTDSQRAHAYEVLNTAVGPEGVEAVLRMMHREIANTHRAIELTKQQLQSGHGGDLPPLTAPPAGPDVPGSQGMGIMETLKNAVGLGSKGQTKGGIKWSIEGQ